MKCTRGASRIRWPMRKTETLAECANTELGKASPPGTESVKGTWRAMRRASSGTSAAKGRQGKIWIHYWMGQGICWLIKWKSPKYSLSSLNWYFQLEPAFRNLRVLRPVGHSGTRNTYPCEDNDQVNEHVKNQTYITPWDMIRYTNKLWGSWQISLQGCFYL